MGIKDFFRRKKDDTIVDLGSLHRKGVIKKQQSDERTIDLTQHSGTTPDSSPLGFLGAMAGAASDSTESGISEIESSIILSTERKNKLRGILRDLKGKIDSTHNKIYNLSERIDLLERKIERLERRAGV